LKTTKRQLGRIRGLASAEAEVGAVAKVDQYIIEGTYTFKVQEFTPPCFDQL
jgi:hypothetical protein